MAIFDADQPEFDMPCGNCDKTTQILYGRLKTDKHVICAHCGMRTDIEQDDIGETLDRLNSLFGGQ